MPTRSRFKDACVFMVLIIIFYVNKSVSLECYNVEICRQLQYITCELCIQAHPCCTWCSDVDFENIRCDTFENLKELKCSKSFIVHGGNSEILSILKQEFSNADESQNKSAVQIKPKEINVALRLHDPITFQLNYKAAKNYPLDLYYLMDLTKSMYLDLGTMKSLGESISEELKMLTTKYKIAFGYYSDKVASPFAMMDSKSLENPCSSIREECAKGFNFIHALNFTDSVADFEKKLRKCRVTANADNLEGGMDAVMQIVACQKYMRWRRFSRKIVVVATGGLMHLAGDGVLSGSIKKNPGICMVDKGGAYNSLVYDYPSLEEIYKKLQQEKTNLLFAAKADVVKYYKKLHMTIPDVSTVGELEMESKNVLKLIKDSYEKVVSNVKFSHSPNEYVKITYETSCQGVKSNKREKSHCKNVEIGKEYVFDVTLELIKLPEEKTHDIINIEEMNLFEFTKVNVRYIGVKCNCQESGTKPCGEHGQFKCGTCKCDKGWTGSNCSIRCDENACRFSNSTYISSTCLGRGECDFATCTCLCDRRYYGNFCEYHQCPINKKTGKICTGEKEGTCVQGKCVCTKHYNGPDCSCYNKNDTCIAPGQSKVCNDAGECVCGKCQCKEGYWGRFCESCPGCDVICSKFEQCVIGVHLNNSVDNCIRNGTKFEAKKNELAEDMCLARYINEEEETCDIKYSYTYEVREVILEYREPYCSKALAASTAGMLAFAVVVIIGILSILAIKARNAIQDKREFAKHERELDKYRNTREENPLYLSPITKHENPLRKIEQEEDSL